MPFGRRPNRAYIVASDSTDLLTASPPLDEPQPVAAQLTRTAIFLVVTIKPGLSHRATIRSFCGDLAALLRAVGFRDIEGRLSCVMGFGSDAWNQLFGSPRPAE